MPPQDAYWVQSPVKGIQRIRLSSQMGGCRTTHRAVVDEGLDGAPETLLQVREPRHVRRNALPRYPQQLAVHKLRLAYIESP